LGFEAGQAFSEFNRLLLQDGSSFALHEALAEVFPGRFNLSGSDSPTACFVRNESEV
jgi:hypothetical protein